MTPSSFQSCQLLLTLALRRCSKRWKITCRILRGWKLYWSLKKLAWRLNGKWMSSWSCSTRWLFQCTNHGPLIEWVECLRYKHSIISSPILTMTKTSQNFPHQPSSAFSSSSLNTTHTHTHTHTHIPVHDRRVTIWKVFKKGLEASLREDVYRDSSLYFLWHWTKNFCEHTAATLIQPGPSVVRETEGWTSVMALLGTSGPPHYCTSICKRSWCNRRASCVDLINTPKKKSCSQAYGCERLWSFEFQPVSLSESSQTVPSLSSHKRCSPPLPLTKGCLFVGIEENNFSECLDLY